MQEPQPTQLHRILVVDDVAEVRNSLRRMLGRLYDMTVASSGEQALEIIQELEEGEEFSVVISDQEMPGLSGIEFLEHVRLDHPDTVRIMLTGLPGFELAVDAMHQGQVFRFLAKPCMPQQLRDAVAEAVELRVRLVEERQQASRLNSTFESLESRNRSLEERINNQSHSLHCMHRFAVELNEVTDLHGVAQASARALFETLGDRGIHVQIWDPTEVGVEASLGPEMSTDMLSESITTADGQVGEIVVDEWNAEGEQLSPATRDMIAAIASTTAVAVHNEFRRRERDEAQYSTIVALARLSEKRDNETGLHLERVSQYCEMVAQRLRATGLHTELINDEYIRDLQRSAPLHDIGKVGIPDSILLKPGKLNASEWEIMQTHPEIGATTLESVILENSSQGFLLMGRDIAWCHHEKWDGSGYPRGLRGEQIPLSARILALADVYDALTTVRPYKNAWTHEEAMNWIEEGSGTHFDPEVVRAFFEVGEQANEVRARLADQREEVARKKGLDPLRRSA